MAKLFVERSEAHRTERKVRQDRPERDNHTMDIEIYRNKLLAKERELLDDLRRSGLSGREESAGDPLDTIDESVSSLHKEIAFAQADRDAKLLNQVRAALQRISQGTYGQCLEDGEIIMEARLHAVPWASYCVKHQELLDMVVGGNLIAA